MRTAFTFAWVPFAVGFAVACSDTDAIRGTSGSTDPDTVGESPSANGGQGGVSGGGGVSARTGGEGGVSGGGTEGGGGSVPPCGECFPYGSRCSNGVVDYRLGYGSACEPDYHCNFAQHACELGCWEEGAHWGPNLREVFSHCEETGVRGGGFPCRGDIDCVTPIGATLESHLNTAPTSGLGGVASDAGELYCSEQGACAFGGSGAGDDFGEACSIVTSEVQPGPVVGFAETCASGACLVMVGGSSTGTCTISCGADSDCPPDQSCADVLDNRYSVWSFIADSVLPPRILACIADGV